MNKLFKTFALLVLLLAVQHSAVVHEFAHVAELHSAVVRVDGTTALQSPCVLCPAFAQVMSPAVAPIFTLPPLSRGGVLIDPASPHRAIDAASPLSCSRGPPALLA